MKKILFIHHAIGWGGAPINMINIINSLDKSKYSVKVLLIQDSVVSNKLSENNIPYKIAQANFFKNNYKFYNYSVPNNTKWYQIFKQVKLILSWFLTRYYFASRELENHEFDIVHLNSSVLTDWLAPSKRKGKVVMHIQEPLTKGLFGIRYKFFRKLIKKHADSVIAISKDNANRLNLTERTSIIYNFTEILYEKPEIKSYKSRKVLYVGGEEYIKGFYTLIDALEFIDGDIKIVFAGHYSPQKNMRKTKFRSPKDRKKWETLKKMRSNKNVVEIGAVTNITSLLEEVVCLASPFSVPHFSRPIIEAFANYKPVVATNVDGMNEIVENNINGILVGKNQPKDLANAINFLCNNDVIAMEMGQKGYEKAQKLYSPKNITQIEKIYDEI